MKLTVSGRRIALISMLMALLLCVSTVCAAGGASISGVAYLDADENAEYTEGDTLLSGVPVVLECLKDDEWVTVGNAETDESGAYAFIGLEDGEYRLASGMSGAEYCEKAIGSFSYWEGGLVRSDAFVLSDGDSVSDQNILVEPSVKVAVTVFDDADGNLEQGKYEKGIKGVKVEALQSGSQVAAAETDKAGKADLMLPAGEYELRVLAPGGYGLLFIAEDTSFGASVTEGSMELDTEYTQAVTAGCKQVSYMTGTAFEDSNNNGIWDDGESVIPGVRVHVEGAKNGVVQDTETDEAGVFTFMLPGKETYTISSELPDGMLYARYSKEGGNKRSIFTRTNLTREYKLKTGTTMDNLNIGAIQKGVIQGDAFLDLNYNGVWNEGEPGYAKVTVEAIKLSSGDSCGKTVTDASGHFVIENLRSGEYKLRAVLPDDGSIFSAVGKGTSADVNLFEQRGVRRESFVTPLALESGTEVNALIGVAQGASVSGYVFQDADYSGAMNGKEKAIQGIKVRAVDMQGNVVAEDVTGKSGLYKLEGILPGTYVVEFQRKAGFGFTRCRSGENKGSNVTTIENGWGVCTSVTLTMGQKIENYYAGMLPSATVAGNLYLDANDNGTRDRKEMGLAGTKVRLWSEEAEMDFTETVADDGSFKFAGVMPGTYDLEYILPENTEMTGGTQRVIERVAKVAMGDDVTLKDALCVQLGTYSGSVVNSETGDLIAGAKIMLTPSGNDKAETVTVTSMADGTFEALALRPAEYQLTVELPAGYIFAADADAEGLTWPATGSTTQTVAWKLLTAYNAKTIDVVQPAAFSGVVWMDENKNASREDDEWIMEDLNISLLNAEGTTVAQCVTTSGGYAFEMRPGTYFISFELPEQASPAGEKDTQFALAGSAMQSRALTVSSGEVLSELNVGLVSTTSMAGVIRVDENGLRSEVAGAKVELLLDGKTKDKTVTGSDGRYQFDGLWPNDYVVRVTLPDGAIFIHDDDPNYTARDTVVHGSTSATSESAPIHLQMAQHQMDLDVLCIKPAALGDIAWLDENANGVVDGDEARIPGVTVRLVQNGDVIYETTTDIFGCYLFNGVYPGTYVLQAEAYEELTPTKQVPALHIISTCLVSGDGMNAESESFSVLSGSRNMNMDLGYVLRKGSSVPSAIRAPKPEKDWTLINQVQTGTLGDPSALKNLNK